MYRITDCPDMTSAVDCGHKALTQHNNITRTLIHLSSVLLSESICDCHMHIGRWIVAMVTIDLGQNNLIICYWYSGASFTS